MKLNYGVPVSKNSEGWPWNEAQDLTLYDSHSHWPLISVIIPSYNQDRFLEETLRSIILQNYPALQVILIDGGSTDSSSIILSDYSKFLDYWISEPDKGQSDALNKGFQRASGEIICWINSDDTLLPGALKNVAELFRLGSTLMIGEVALTNEFGEHIEYLNVSRTWNHLELLSVWKPSFVPSQPGIFFSRSLIDRPFLVRSDLNYAMDYELWLYLSSKVKFTKVDKVVATYRLHESSKTVTEDGYLKFEPEWKRVSTEYLAKQNFGVRIFLYFQRCIYRYKIFFCRHISGVH